MVRSHEDFLWLHSVVEENPGYAGLIIPPRSTLHYTTLHYTSLNAMPGYSYLLLPQAPQAGLPGLPGEALQTGGEGGQGGQGGVC